MSASSINLPVKPEAPIMQPPVAGVTIGYDSLEDDGQVRIATEYTADEFDKLKLPGDFLSTNGAIITTSTDRSYYLKGNQINDLVSSVRRQSDAEWILSDGEDVSVVIGQKWQFDFNGSPEDTVTKVEVNDEIVPTASLNSNSDPLRNKRGMDPFVAAEAVVERLDRSGYRHDPSLSHERFTPDQAYLSWFWKNRRPGLKKLFASRQIGKLAMATVATGLDFAVNTNLYNRKFADTIEALPEPEPRPSISTRVKSISPPRIKLPKAVRPAEVIARTARQAKNVGQLATQQIVKWNPRNRQSTILAGQLPLEPNLIALTARNTDNQSRPRKKRTSTHTRTTATH